MCSAAERWIQTRSYAGFDAHVQLAVETSDTVEACDGSAVHTKWGTVGGDHIEIAEYLLHH